MAIKKLLKMKSFYVALLCSVFFVAALGTSTLAWFRTSRVATVNFSSVTVKGNGIKTMTWKIIKNDGSYASADGFKDSSGTTISSFYMNKYDRLIPDKNDVANMILVA